MTTWTPSLGQLNAVTSRLGDELRKENAKVIESMKILKGIANGAVDAVRTLTSSPQLPPGLAGVEKSAAALETCMALAERRIEEIAVVVESHTSELQRMQIQVASLSSAFIQRV